MTPHPNPSMQSRTSEYTLIHLDALMNDQNHKRHLGENRKRLGSSMLIHHCRQCYVRYLGVYIFTNPLLAIRFIFD